MKVYRVEFFSDYKSFEQFQIDNDIDIVKVINDESDSRIITLHYYIEIEEENKVKKVKRAMLPDGQLPLTFEELIRADELMNVLAPTTQKITLNLDGEFIRHMSPNSYRPIVEYRAILYICKLMGMEND